MQSSESGKIILAEIDLSMIPHHLDHYVRLSMDARSDIEWWAQYVESWNGIQMMRAIKGAAPAAVMTSDASGGWGCGAYAGPHWFILKWAGPISECHITVKEMVPIVIAAALWAPSWHGKNVIVQCDNSAVVSIINHGASKNQDAMHLARCLAFITAKFDFHMQAAHIKGVDNILADALSRDNLPLFRSLHPQADKDATPIPEPLFDLLILSKPDWTSRHWTGLWNSIFRMD